LLDGQSEPNDDGVSGNIPLGSGVGFSETPLRPGTITKRRLCFSTATGGGAPGGICQRPCWGWRAVAAASRGLAAVDAKRPAR
jgi:hypothetical protein